MSDYSPKHLTPVRKKLRQKLILRWLILLAVGVAMAAAYFFALPHCDRTEGQIMLLLSIGVFLFVLWRTHVLRRTFAREWAGTITGQEIKKTIRSKTALMTRASMEYTLVCRWTILRDPPAGEKPDTERDTFTITYDTSEIGEHFFRIGDRVRHYKNAVYMIKDDPDPRDEELMCPLCGHLTREPVCYRCRVDFSGERPAVFSVTSEKENTP